MIQASITGCLKYRNTVANSAAPANIKTSSKYKYFKECLGEDTSNLNNANKGGYFYILDRKKDMLIVGGLNVYAQEVEKVLNNHPDVAESAVLGKPDKVRGEVPIAFVVPVEGKEVDPDELKKFCREHLASYKVPRQITIRESFPKTATGKVMKWKLKKSLG